MLNNWRRHREDRATRAALDPYASGAQFDGWKYYEDTDQDIGIADALALPKSWLLSTGWRRHGLISPWEVPKGNA